MDSGQPPSANDHPTKLLVVLGDQLAQPHPVQETLHPSRDALWMAEVPGESLHVPSHAARTVMFLSAMRHFARRQREDGWALHYHALGDHGHHTLESALEADLRRLRPREVQVLQPGEVGDDALYRHLVTGEGAGLVRADGGNRAQGLDRRQAADDRVTGSHPLNPDRQGDGHDRWQPLGNRRNGKAGCSEKGLYQVVVAHPEAECKGECRQHANRD